MDYEDFAPQISVLASLSTAPYPETLAEAGLASYYATDYTRMMSIPPEPPCTVPGYQRVPMTLAELHAAQHYITPHDRAVQALKREIRDLQERTEIAEYRQQIAELRAQIGQHYFRIAELEVQIAELHALTEALLRKLYQLQLLAPTCEACHIAFNGKKADGTLDIKAQKNATVCNHQLGDPDCPKRQKAQEMAERRAEKKRTDRVASNEYESTGN